MPDPGVAIVPVKLRSPKLRLAGRLGPREREELAAALLQHVVGVLAGAGLTVYALCRGTPPLLDVDVVRDEAATLNGSVDALVAQVGAPVAVVPSDLPWLLHDDVHELLSVPGDVVVAPTSDGGTGALVMRTPIHAAFGPRSALAHAAEAHRRGLRARVVAVAGFGRDLDDETDLESALATAPGLAGFGGRL